MASRTSAEKVAFTRALGSLEPDPAVRNPDFVSREMLRDVPSARVALWLAERVPGVRVGLRSAFERLMPGACWGETARVKHFDAILLGEVAAGVGQVVVLGAGLDSRACRFARQLRGVRVFEVDQPLASSHKRERLEAVCGGLPDGVSCVGVDLTDSMPDEALAGAGFVASEPALVLWIGVAQYLPVDVVVEVLRWVGEHPTGSSVGFDYLESGFFDKDRSGRGARLSRYLIERSGERFRSSLDPSAVPALLAGCGLAVKSHLGPREVEHRYLRRSDGEAVGRAYGHSSFVHAEVAA